MYTRIFSLALSMTAFGFGAHAADPLQPLNSASVEQADPAIVELGHMLFFDPAPVRRRVDLVRGLS